MRWIEQTVNSVGNGDCLASALSSITGLSVPSLIEDSGWFGLSQAWLRAHGWTLNDDDGTRPQPGWSIAVGKSPTLDANHACIRALRNLILIVLIAAAGGAAFTGPTLRSVATDIPTASVEPSMAEGTGTLEAASGNPSRQAGAPRPAGASTLHNRAASATTDERGRTSPATTPSGPALTGAPPKATMQPGASPLHSRQSESRNHSDKPSLSKDASTKRVSTKAAVSIRATWYCSATSRCTVGHPDGLYAAISPDLASWTGHLVRACYRGRCVVVRVIDCLCSRLGGIDLYSTAYERLAPLSTGEIVVTAEVVG